MTELELIKAAQSGDLTARNQLVEQYTNWIWKIALMYKRRCRWVELEDLVQAGTIGFMNSVRKYDPERNVKLISYSCFWIKAKILRLLDTESVIKIASTRTYIGKKIRKHDKEARLAFGVCNLSDKVIENWDLRVDNPHQIVEDEEEKRIKFDKVMELVEKLPVKYRDALLETVLEGKTLMTVSKENGVSKQLIQQRRKAALRRIRKGLGIE